MGKKKIDPLVVQEVVAEMARQGLVVPPPASKPKAEAKPRTKPVQAVIKLLDDERDRQGLTEYALAKRAGMPSATIGRILNGERPDPQLSSIVTIAQALGCEVVLKRTEG
jgi:DNA-binding phage protein